MYKFTHLRTTTASLRISQMENQNLTINQNRDKVTGFGWDKPDEVIAKREHTVIS